MSDAIHYECQRCTHCCRWPGFVKVGAAEIARIAAHLGLSEGDFIQRYTRLRPERDGLALIDKGASHECIFLEGRDCVIQAVKPVQCAGFPNTWNFPGWRESCEAVPSRRAGNSKSESYIAHASDSGPSPQNVRIRACGSGEKTVILRHEEPLTFSEGGGGAEPERVKAPRRLRPQKSEVLRSSE